MSLTDKILSGVVWNIIQLVISRAFGFIIKLVLAKLLFPEQFGLIGMATVFTSVLQVFNDFGMSSALIQMKEEHIKDVHYYTAFWTGLAWSIFLYGVIAIIVAPLVASFYDEPILKLVIPAISLNLLVSPLNLVHYTKLTRDINFKKISIINTIASILAGILSLVLAYNGAGVWSLVFNSVAVSVFALPLYLRATKWMPRAVWEEKAFKDIFSFGFFATSTAILTRVISQLDYLIIGKLLGASLLGVYTLAFVLTQNFKSQLVYLINKVMYPVYGQKQEDVQSLKKYYLNIIRINSLIVYPVMVILVVLGESFVLTFFGKNWIGTVIPLKILSVSIFFQMMISGYASLIRGMGFPKLEMKIQMYKAFLYYIPLIIIGIHYWGIIGASCAILFSQIIDVAVVQYYLKNIVGITVKDLFKSIKTPFIAAGLLILSSYLINIDEFNFYLGSILICIGYFSIVYTFMRNDFRHLFKYIAQLKKRQVYKL